jgi:Flp pilus assembly protein TadG
LRVLSKRSGAALVEACLVIVMLCLILFGILQVSYLIMAKDVLSLATFSAARSATVGMSDEFIDRVARAASIPTAGPMVSRAFMNEKPLAGTTYGKQWDNALAGDPQSDQYWYEKDAIPYYLGAVDSADLPGILDYYNWKSGDTDVSASRTGGSGGSYIDVEVVQNVPLEFPFAEAFYRANMGTMVRPGATERVPRWNFEETVSMENHSALYLEKP